MLRIQHCLDNRFTGSGDVVSLTGRPRSTLQKHFIELIYFRGFVNLRAIVRLEVLCKLKKIQLIGIRSRDLPVCSLVPQPTTLPGHLTRAVAASMLKWIVRQLNPNLVVSRSVQRVGSHWCHLTHTWGAT
jgi:hypothetical protein